MSITSASKTTLPNTPLIILILNISTNSPSAIYQNPAGNTGAEGQHSAQTAGDVEKAFPGGTLANKSTRFGGEGVPNLPDLPPAEGEPQGASGNVDKIGGAVHRDKDKIERGAAAGSGRPGASASASRPSEDDEFALLAKRFEALKRR